MKVSKSAAEIVYCPTSYHSFKQGVQQNLVHFSRIYRPFCSHFRGKKAAGNSNFSFKIVRWHPIYNPKNAKELLIKSFELFAFVIFMVTEFEKSFPDIVQFSLKK